MFAGIQLLVLGVIGEYVGRIYEQVKLRPMYVVEKVVDATNAQIDDNFPVETASLESKSETSNSTFPIVEVPSADCSNPINF